MRRSPIERAEELWFMQAIPFRYYVLGFRDAVRYNDFGRSDMSDAASCFLDLVLRKLQHAPGDIEPVMPQLVETIEYVAKHQSLYHADPEIYGDFGEKLNRIKAIYTTFPSSQAEMHS